MENEIKKKEENMHLMRSLSELEDGEYNVSTSRGNFKIEKITKPTPANYYSYQFYGYDIKITDENGDLFSHYYFLKHEDSLGRHRYENEIDIPDKINFEHGYDIDYNNHNIKVYLNNEHTEYYLISEKVITKWEKTTCEHLARIYDNKIIGQKLAIDLKSFDRMIIMNHLILDGRIEIKTYYVRVSSEKNIEEELTTYKEKIKYIENDEYLKNIIDKKLIEILDIDISDIKQEESKLIELSKLYAKAMSLKNNIHELSIMREIVDGLKPEFNKLSTYDKSIVKSKPEKNLLNRRDYKSVELEFPEFLKIKDLKKKAAYR